MTIAMEEHAQLINLTKLRVAIVLQGAVDPAAVSYIRHLVMPFWVLTNNCTLT